MGIFKNKYIINIVLSIVLVGLLSGCNNTSDSGSVSSSSISKESNDSLDSVDLYERFLSGEESVYFNRYNPDMFDGYDYETEEYTKAYTENTPYKLTDILKSDAKAISGDYIDSDDEIINSIAKVNSVDYAYIDLGKDGIKELAVSIGYSSDDSYTDAFYTYIIKDFDSKLEVIYRLESVGRSYEDLNGDFGLINSFGSYGYAQGMDNLYYLDKDGVLNTVYKSEYSYLLDEFFFGKEAVERFMGDDDEYVDDIQYYRYVFTDFPDVMEDLYSFYRDNGVYVVSMGDDPEFIDELASVSKVTFVSEDDLLKMIDNRKKELGCPDDDETYEIEWISLENPDIKEIITFGFYPVYVDNAEDFINAIDNNKTLVIDSSATINISEYIDSNFDNLMEWDYDDENPSPGVYVRYVGDGYELMVYGINNLKITSSDSKDKPSILCVPRYANVISFEYCNLISLEGLFMGHTIEEGYCSGAVINFSNCENKMTVNSCELYGCGTYGITAYDSTYVEAENTIIRDCSYGCIDMSNVSLASFGNCTFNDCREFTMFDLKNTDVWFRNCNFKNLDGDMIYLTENNNADFNDCTFDKNALDGLENYEGPGNVRIN